MGVSFCEGRPFGLVDGNLQQVFSRGGCWQRLLAAGRFPRPERKLGGSTSGSSASSGVWLLLDGLA